LDSKSDLLYQIGYALDHFTDELKEFQSNLNKYAKGHINSNETIMVFGLSHTILSSLADANKTQSKKFQVLVVEGSVGEKGKTMVDALSEVGIESFLIHCSNIYAAMERVDKVILSSHAILADGGCLCESGSLLVATAARAFSVPVLVLGGMFKLTPHYSVDQETNNSLIPPAKFFVKSDKENSRLITPLLPRFDFVSRDLILLLITNMGEHTPHYIYSLFSQYYHKDYLKASDIL
jgi:translation initiation factor eIF-2B subunit beta